MENFLEMFERLGPPDTVIGFSHVPASYQEELGGAELACEHITEKGTLGMPKIHIGCPVGEGAGDLRGKLIPVCPECLPHMPRLAWKALGPTCE